MGDRAIGVMQNGSNGRMRAPPPKRTRPSRSGALTPFIGDTSIMRPPVVEKPA
jgi:hypothetical protein